MVLVYCMVLAHITLSIIYMVLPYHTAAGTATGDSLERVDMSALHFLPKSLKSFVS